MKSATRAIATAGAALAVLFGAWAPEQGLAAKGDSGVKTAKILLDLAHPKGLERFTRQVSTPGSGHYRDYRTPAALIERFGAGVR